MIRLRDVTVAYGDRVILDNINLDIHQGETLAILGASGSGKSTILRLIIGHIGHHEVIGGEPCFALLPADAERGRKSERLIALEVRRHVDHQRILILDDAVNSFFEFIVFHSCMPIPSSNSSPSSGASSTEVMLTYSPMTPSAL